MRKHDDLSHARQKSPDLLNRRERPVLVQARHRIIDDYGLLCQYRVLIEQSKEESQGKCVTVAGTMTREASKRATTASTAIPTIASKRTGESTRLSTESRAVKGFSPR